MPQILLLLVVAGVQGRVPLSTWLVKAIIIIRQSGVSVVNINRKCERKQTLTDLHWGGAFTLDQVLHFVRKY